jgi:hypothetical protein
MHCAVDPSRLPILSTIFRRYILYKVWKAATEIGTMRATYPPHYGGFSFLITAGDMEKS